MAISKGSPPGLHKRIYLLTALMVTYTILSMSKLKQYRDDSNAVPYEAWESSLPSVIAARITKYVKRMENGNFGNSEPVGSGVSELKINLGPGYRVYYGLDGDTLVILLGGGSKKRQSRDIKDAIDSWMIYKQRKREAKRQSKTAHNVKKGD
jgi:putative addiction module killer protein